MAAIVPPLSGAIDVTVAAGGRTSNGVRVIVYACGECEPGFTCDATRGACVPEPSPD